MIEEMIFDQTANWIKLLVFIFIPVLLPLLLICLTIEDAIDKIRSEKSE